MSASNRDASISKTLVHEGGYVNHPSDPGGATNYGITIAVARQYWKANATPTDIRAMPISVAIEIYRKRYWNAIAGDTRPAGVDYAEYDFAVNSGTSRALKFRAALPALAPVPYIKAFCAKRTSFLRALRTFATFGKGWARRVASVEAEAIKMALKASGEPIEPKLTKESKVAKDKAVKNGTAATGAVAIPGGATQAPQAPDLSTIDMGTKAGLAVAALVVIGFIGYFAWNAYNNYQRSKAFKAAAQEG